jgi:hypothetical protein
MSGKAVSMTVPPDVIPPLLDEAPAGGTPPAPAASLVRPDTLLIMDLPSRSSPVWRDDPRQLRLNHCRYKYG